MAQLSHFSNVSGPQFFRLNHLEEGIEFISKEEMKLNKRFKLLKLRSNGVHQFKHYLNVPINEKLINDEVFEVRNSSKYNM